MPKYSVQATGEWAWCSSYSQHYKKINPDASVPRIHHITYSRKFSRIPEGPMWSRMDLHMVTFLLKTHRINYSRWNSCERWPIQAILVRPYNFCHSRNLCLAWTDLVAYLQVNSNHASSFFSPNVQPSCYTTPHHRQATLWLDGQHKPKWLLPSDHPSAPTPDLILPAAHTEFFTIATGGDLNVTLTWKSVDRAKMA